METLTTGKLLCVVSLGILGTVATFFAGAHVGATLNGEAHAITIARMPLPHVNTTTTRSALAAFRVKK